MRPVEMTLEETAADLAAYIEMRNERVRRQAYRELLVKRKRSAQLKGNLMTVSYGGFCEYMKQVMTAKYHTGWPPQGLWGTDSGDRKRFLGMLRELRAWGVLIKDKDLLKVLKREQILYKRWVKDGKPQKKILHY